MDDDERARVPGANERRAGGARGGVRRVLRASEWFHRRRRGGGDVAEFRREFEHRRCTSFIRQNF